MPLTDETKDRAMSEIIAFQAALWRQQTGEDAKDEDVSEASRLWFESMIATIFADNCEMMPNFITIPEHQFMTAVIAKWMEILRQKPIILVQLCGLSETTAQALVEEILADS